MNKQELLERIIERLAQEADALAKGARSAHQDATDPESKAENKYDTRGLEASYLAGAQSKMAADALHTLSVYQTMELKEFSDHTPIGLTAYVVLESDDGMSSFYFLGDKGGGIEVIYEGKKVLLITPASPIGNQLMGRTVGDSFFIQSKNKKTEYEIISVC